MLSMSWSQVAAQRLEAAVTAVELLRGGVDGERHPALRAVGDGPQALARLYPAMHEVVFTCGDKTLGNAGHSMRYVRIRLRAR